MECSDGSYYTGSTIDLQKRINEQHNGQGTNHTKKRLPIKLVYVEEYLNIATAFEREKQIQGWSRAKKEVLITGDFDALPNLSECKNETNFKYYKEKK